MQDGPHLTLSTVEGNLPGLCGVYRGMGGEPAADFEEFVANRAAVLLRYAHVLTGDRHRAEDLVQSALASCYRRWGRVRPGEEERYVRKAILNAHLSWWRRPARRREVTTADVSVLSAASAVVASVDATWVDRDEVWQALATLPPRQRAVLVLRYNEDGWGQPSRAQARPSIV